MLKKPKKVPIEEERDEVDSFWDEVYEDKGKKKPKKASKKEPDDYGGHKTAPKWLLVVIAIGIIVSVAVSVIAISGKKGNSEKLTVAVEMETIAPTEKISLPAGEYLVNSYESNKLADDLVFNFTAGFWKVSVSDNTTLCEIMIYGNDDRLRRTLRVGTIPGVLEVSVELKDNEKLKVSNDFTLEHVK